MQSVPELGFLVPELCFFFVSCESLGGELNWAVGAGVELGPIARRRRLLARD